MEILRKEIAQLLRDDRAEMTKDVYAGQIPGDDLRLRRERSRHDVVPPPPAIAHEFWIHDVVRLRVRLGKIPRRFAHYGCNANAIPRWHFEEYSPPGVHKSIR